MLANASEKASLFMLLNSSDFSMVTQSNADFCERLYWGHRSRPANRDLDLARAVATHTLQVSLRMLLHDRWAGSADIEGEYPAASCLDIPD